MDFKTEEGSRYSADFANREDTESQQLNLIRLASKENLDKLGTYIRNGIWDTNDFDLDELLRNLTALASHQEIKARTTGVVFEDLSVYGEDKTLSYYPTLTELLKGPYYGVKKLASIGKGSKPKPRTILNKFNGLAKPGEMVLVLGRPGAGCTTLLKTLSGNDMSLYTGFEGEVSYDGIPQKKFLKSFKGDLIYNPELDIHFPFLKVGQTLEFAIGLNLPRTRIDNVHEKKYIEAFKKVLLTILGLTHTENTLVGNDYVRGVSGGERKRVSIAEALACRGSVQYWDNSTRGLDASTALEFVQILRSISDHLQKTQFVTIYQASENIYNLFDKVTVLYHGKQVYFGPVGEAKAYFENMGFECPPRQSTSEFLTAITDPLARYPKKGYESVVPRVAEEFEAAWLNSDQYKRLVNEMAVYKNGCNHETVFQNLKESKTQEIHKRQRFNSDFTTSYANQLRWCTIRAFQITKNNRNYILTQIVAALVQGLVFGSLFYNIPSTSEGIYPKSAVLFTLVLTVALMGASEMSMVFEKRPVLLKQRKYSMYHLSCESMAYTMNYIPQALLVSIFLTVPLYFLPGLKADAGAFFIRLLFVFLASLSMSSFFQLVATLSKAYSGAMAVGGIVIFGTIIYTSFMIQKPSMHPWFSWITWINPMYYCFEAMLATEFHGQNLQCAGTSIIPNGPGYQNLSTGLYSCAQAGAITGTSLVDGDAMLRVSFDYYFKHTWRNFGAALAFIIGLNFLICLAADLYHPVASSSDTLLFLRGKVPDHLLVVPETTKSDDEESKSVQTSNSEAVFRHSPSEKKATFDDLKSKDLFAWKNINYTIQIGTEKRLLLNNVSGYCEPGTLTALMGESGAGKTTLLNALAQRLDVGVVTGDMFVNGHLLDESFRRRTGYVQQQDIHVAQSTVRESLIFAAKLRRGKEVSDEEKIAYVDKIIDILHMHDYAHAIVGAPGAGLNVEQRKKLSIGVELVTKPSLLLFLDEPTSGLDSQSAWAVTKLMRELSEAGQSILCTIHQPSATLFEEFDRLLLLQKGGKTVYFGDIGTRARTLLEYFESSGAPKCGEHENPAEYILESIGAGATSASDKDWFEIWNNSEQKKIEDRKLDHLMEKYHSTENSTAEEHLKDTYAMGYLYQFKVVVERTSLTIWRNPEYVMSKLFMFSFCSLFVGFTFWDLGASAIDVRNGAFASLMMVIIQIPATNQIQENAIHSRMLYEARESLSRTYHWSIVWLGQYVNELPYLFLGNVILFCGVIFPLRTDNAAHLKGIAFFTISVVTTMFTCGFALALLFISVDLASAAVISSLFFTFMVQFNGVVQPPNLMPKFWLFMYRVSPATYQVQTLIGSIIHGREVVCKPGEMAYFSSPSGQTCGEFMEPYMAKSGGYLVDSSSSNCTFCPYSVGDQLMLQFGAKWSQRWRNIGIIWAFVVFNIVAGLLLYWAIRVRRFRPKFKFLNRKK